MPKIKSASENTKLAQAALRLAASGWKNVTWDKIAQAVKTSPAKLREKYSSTAALASLIAEEIDREAFAVQKFSGSAHDILFDILMARFDILQKYRQAILNMGNAGRQERALACALARATIDGTYRIIDTAKITSPPRPILAAGVTAIYGWAFFAWQRDKSRDMAKTMAALDRALRLARKALELAKTSS